MGLIVEAGWFAPFCQDLVVKKAKSQVDVDVESKIEEKGCGKGSWSYMRPSSRITLPSRILRMKLIDKLRRQAVLRK